MLRIIIFVLVNICLTKYFLVMPTFKKVKGKVFSVLLFEHHAMKAYWRSGGIAPCILDLGTRLGEWSASRPGRFTPRERAPDTHWIGRWVGPRTVLDTVVKRKIPSNCRDSNH
jgi:hypothetical protein